MSKTPLWEHAATVAIVVCGVVLSIVWAISVPVFENPDEGAHFDYVLGIRTAGRLLLAREGKATLDDDPALIYLVNVTGLDRIAFHANERVTQGYGSAAWIALADGGAPPPDRAAYRVPGHKMPALVATYPPGYYVLAALSMAAVQHFRPGLIEGFFGARIFSALVFGMTLFAAASLMRELRLDRSTRLMLLAAIALFPLSSFVTASVQPDVLVALVLTLLCHRLLLYRRDPTLANAIMLAALLFAGCLVKPIYTLPALATYATVLISAGLRRPLARWKHAVHGIVGLGAFLLAYGVDRFVSYLPPSLAAVSIVPIINASAPRLALAKGTGAFASYVGSTLVTAVTTFFFDGGAQFSYWGDFGWLDAPLHFFRDDLDSYMPSAAYAFRIVVAVLGLVMFAGIVVRCIIVAKQRSLSRALSLFFNDVPLTLLLLYDALMLGLAVAIPTLGYQGRYWFPVIVVSMIAMVRYGSHLVPFVRSRVALQRILAAFLCAWSLIASQGAAQTVRLRYYALNAPSPSFAARFGFEAVSERRSRIRPPGASPSAARADRG